MITHDYKLIFIHLPKTGGRSVCDAFNQRFDHFTADYYRAAYLPFFPDYKMFAIIRNPYDRMVSLFHYIAQHRRHVHEAVYNLGIPGQKPSFDLWLRTNIEHYMGDFHPILHPEGHRGTDGALGSTHHFCSLYSRLGHDTSDITLLRYEDGFDKLAAQVSQMAGTYITFPHHNKSNHGDYRRYYDDKLLDYLHSFKPFMEDVNAFGYKFDVAKLLADSSL
jgi:hypothetical protein